MDTDAPQPVKLSTPLFDALPATEPLNTPVIPGAGAPSQFNVAPEAVVGSVLSVRDLQTNADRFYVLLRNGVQPISPFVASLLRSAPTSRSQSEWYSPSGAQRPTIGWPPPDGSSS